MNRIIQQYGQENLQDGHTSLCGYPAPRWKGFLFQVEMCWQTQIDGSWQEPEAYPPLPIHSLD